jgi:hypothetical protein
MEISLEFAIIGVGVGIALIAYALLAQAEDRRSIRESLRGLDGYETVESQRDRELLNPLRDRAILPVLAGMTNLGRRFTPVGYVEGVRHKFVLSGRGDSDAIDRFLAVRVATVVGIPVALWSVHLQPARLRACLARLRRFVRDGSLQAWRDHQHCVAGVSAVRVQLPTSSTCSPSPGRAWLGLRAGADRTIRRAGSSPKDSAAYE